MYSDLKSYPFLNKTNLSLHGKNAIITGANQGIGLATAFCLAKLGATVYLACRNTDKAKNAMQLISDNVHNANLELIELDLQCLESIQRASLNLRKKTNKVDFLINNAGISAENNAKSPNKINKTFMTNHLGTFAFTLANLELLQKEENAKIITISSIAHKKLIFKPNYSKFLDTSIQNHPNAYAESKLANILFANALQKRIIKNNGKQLSIAVHPGFAATNINKQAHNCSTKDIICFLFKGSFNSAIMGLLKKYNFCQKSHLDAVAPIIFALSSKKVKPYSYVGPSKFFQLYGPPSTCMPSNLAFDINLQNNLWDISEKITNFRYF